MMPVMPKTTKTMAPVSTSGRTAGFPQPVFTQGLKPKVAEKRALGTAEGVTSVQAGRAPPPEAPLQPPPCTFLTGHIEEAFGRSVKAGAEQAAGRCHAHTPMERGLVRLGKVEFPVEAKEARLKPERLEGAGEARQVRPCTGARRLPGMALGFCSTGTWSQAGS